MPTVDKTPTTLAPYRAHGVDLQPSSDPAQQISDCPFCSKEGKFSVNMDTGVWRCWHCEAGSDKKGGNAYTFLRLLWEVGDKAGNRTDSLAKDRKLLYPETPERWGVVKSVITGEWLLPGYGADGKIKQLYRYVRTPGPPPRKLLLPTPGLDKGLPRHGLFSPAGVDFASSPKGSTVYVCEGPWDGMALWEVLDAAASLGAEPGYVVAVPTCKTFFDSWAPLFAGKRVILLYDNDYERKHPKTGARIPPAGWEGMRSTVGILSAAKDKPESVRVLRWGGPAPQMPWDVNRPSGFDLRDLLTQAGSSLGARAAAFHRLTAEKVVPPPGDWGRRGGPRVGGLGEGEADCKECFDWLTLRNSARKALNWHHGLDKALAFMLSCVTSTELVGDQLWGKVMGPAASGKSTLCEAISVNKRYIKPLSTLRGMHSGFKSDREGKEDHSLLAQTKNKTLVIKDGDTLLQAPNREQILSELRDVYDRVSRTHYRHGMSRDYEGHCMTLILCGTSSLRALDTSELGERFLDCVIVDNIDEELERSTGWRIANQAAEEMNHLANGQMQTQDAPSMVEFKQLAGGYVSYLRANAEALVSRVKIAEVALRRCQHLAEFVAFMRARPSARQVEKAERELSFRLIKQLVRLGKCLAAVLNRPEVDAEILARLREIALDTARGRVLDLAKILHRAGPKGAHTHSLAIWCNESQEKEGTLLRFLRRIGAVEQFQVSPSEGRVKWRLTPRLARLYREVVGDQDPGPGPG